MGANKNSIKIIGEETDLEVQGYFVYDSKKSGSITISHLRFGPQANSIAVPDHEANFVGCHQFSFLERIDVLATPPNRARPSCSTAPFGPDQVWDHLPRTVQQQIIEKKLKFYVIDGYEVARQTGMGGRINTIMQTCFFAVSGVLPQAAAIGAIKSAIQETYGKRGDAIVQRNFAAVDASLAHLHEVKCPGAKSPARLICRPPVPAAAPAFVQRRSRRMMIANQGDDCPSARSPSTARSRPPRRSGRSATSRRKSRSGRRTCASNAGSACWSVRTRH